MYMQKASNVNSFSTCAGPLRYGDPFW